MKWLEINDRDGGTFNQGRWWFPLVLIALVALGPVLRLTFRTSSFPAFEWFFLAWLGLWTGWVIGAHLWWRRHRRGWVLGH